MLIEGMKNARLIIANVDLIKLNRTRWKRCRVWEDASANGHSFFFSTIWYISAPKLIEEIEINEGNLLPVILLNLF